MCNSGHHYPFPFREKSQLGGRCDWCFNFLTNSYIRWYSSIKCEPYQSAVPDDLNRILPVEFFLYPYPTLPEQFSGYSTRTLTVPVPYPRLT
jgi:hypothetical protein